MIEINNNLLAALQHISRAAGSAIMEIYGETDFGVEHKDDDSPLTRADKASNKVICEGLQKLTPDTPIISEENSIPAYDIRKEYKEYWLIDPLDGTKEFIKRNGDFTTNIALIRYGKPTVGVVFAPVLDSMYYAAEGMGAHKSVNGADAVKLAAKTFDESQEGLIITCSRSHLNEDTTDYIAQYNNPTLQKVGSSLKLMLVAEGSADIYPRLGPISEWDIAASHVIVEQAGGKVYQHEDGQAIPYNKENILMPYFIAEGIRLSQSS